MTATRTLGATCYVVGIIALCLLASVQPVSGQPGYLRVFADVGGTTCTAPDTPAAYLSVYVIHTLTSGANSVQFAVESSNPAGFIYASESSPYPTTFGSAWIHDDNAGGSVAFGGCVGSPNLVKTVNLLTLGSNPSCTTLCAVPDPASSTGTIEVIDCADILRAGYGRCMWINPDAACSGCPIEEPHLVFVDPPTLDFGDTAEQLTFDIVDGSPFSTAWDIVEGISWLTVSPTTGIGGETITANVDRTGLASGNYSGVLTVDIGGSDDVNVPVSMVVESEPIAARKTTWGRIKSLYVGD